VKFIIGGNSYEITRENIFSATKGIAPNSFDGRHRYYVELHGERYPIKQVIHLVTGLDYTADFTAQYAHHILKKLGFTVNLLKVTGMMEPISKINTSTASIEGRQKFAITLEEDEGGFIVASCPCLPGCYSQGRTEEEAIANIREAIRGYIASMRRHGEYIPKIKEVREVEVAI
jgi:antitoxin HicB